MSDLLDEEDLKSIFGRPEILPPPPPAMAPPPPPQPPPAPKLHLATEKVYAPEKITGVTVIKFISLFVGIFIVSYLAINSPAFFKKSRYFWDVSVQKHAYSQAVATPKPNPTGEATLVVPKIGVEAPIIWNVSDADMKAKLLQGVVHSQGTALPGTIGNVFLTGHSSYYPWVESPYKNVFSLLDKLSPGDKIFIRYSNALFTYEVQGSRVVSPTEISVLDQGPDYKLTLMTCVPIGTNLNRLIVSATEIR